MSIDPFKSAYIEDGVIHLELNDSFRPNDAKSTFGFHTAATVSDKLRTHMYVKDSSVKSDEESQIAYAKFKLLTFNRKGDAVALNALTILGYFPVLGLIPCTARLIIPLVKEDSAMHSEPKAVKTAHYIRGAAEGMGIGSLYLIPDLIVTGTRFLKA